VGFQSFPSGTREILQESAFKLIDRCSFVRGDYCKRSQDDLQSGVVLNLKVQFKVQHTITLQSLDQWFDKEHFQASQPLVLGDLVFFNDWVGQVSAPLPNRSASNPPLD
jgi:ubiquitin-conjugating enzyme E2 O